MMLHNNQRPDSPCRFISEMYKNTTPTAEGCTLSKGHSVVPQYIFCSCHLDQILKDNHNVAVGLLPNTELPLQCPGNFTLQPMVYNWNGKAAW